MFETSIDSNKMNNHKVDFVICCDINDSDTVHCSDKGISLLAVSPVREYFIDALDKSDVSTPGSHVACNLTTAGWTHFCLLLIRMSAVE